MEIDEYLEKLIKDGSSITQDKLKKIKEEVLLNIKRNDINKSIANILSDIEESTYNYINSNTIKGISSTIYLQDKSNYYLNISCGKSIHNEFINAYTEFDIASITKLFTLFLVFRYEELGLINLNNKICDINLDFKYLDYTVLDIMKMAGNIITNSRIDHVSNKNDAMNILKTVHPVNYDLNVNHYTDIGFMVLGKIIESISGEAYKSSLEKFLLEYNIQINSDMNIAGNGHIDFKPHDPKARIFDSVIGSAGVFINSINMTRFAKSIFDQKIISKKNLDKLSTHFFKLYHDNRGYAGINLKHPLGIKKSATPNEYSRLSFSHQGFTGSSVIFDPINKIHNSIFVDAIDLNAKAKHQEFFKYYNLYHEELVINSLKLYLIKKYYDKYEKANIKILKTI